MNGLEQMLRARTEFEEILASACQAFRKDAIPRVHLHDVYMKQGVLHIVWLEGKYDLEVHRFEYSGDELAEFLRLFSEEALKRYNALVNEMLTTSTH